MASLAKTTRAIFTINDIAKLADCRPDHADRLYRLHSHRRSTASRDIDLDAVLGALVIAAGEKIGMPTEVVALNVTPLVNRSLSYLGTETMPWPVSGTPAQELQFRQSISEVEGFLRTRKIQDLLNIRERLASRFLVWLGDDNILLTDDLNRLVEDANEAALAIVDVIAIANKVRNYRPDALFTVEYL